MHTTTVFCSDCLGCVFDNGKVEFRCDGVDLVHVGDLAVEVDGDDGFEASPWSMVRGQDMAEMGGVEVEGLWVDVAEDGGCAYVVNNAGGGEEGEAGQDHTIAGTDIEGLQGKQQGICAAGHADGMFHTAIGGCGFFERLNMRPENELCRRYNIENGGIDFVFDGGILAFQVKYRDVHLISLRFIVRGPLSIVRGPLSVVRSAFASSSSPGR